MPTKTSTEAPTEMPTDTPTEAPKSETDASAFKYKQNGDGTIRIVSIINSPEKVVVPKEIYGYTVTEIGDYAFIKTPKGSYAEKMAKEYSIPVKNY